jgi:Domain of unknown function (DUF4382)
MKKFKKSIQSISILCLSIIVFFIACQKQIDATSNDQERRKLSVYLTDDPCQYDSVFIDIRFVEVKIDTTRKHDDDDHHGDDDDDMDDDHQHSDSFGKWDTLSIRPGVYNILKLRNGIDTLLATGNIPAGAIRKIRITLGTNNSVVKNGVTYSLSLLAGQTNYVYVKIHKECEDEISVGQTGIWLDFDVCESIKFKNGQYYLKPFLKVFSMKQFGKIEGKVFPRVALPFVKVYNAFDSASAIPENDGKYKIRGLREGVYTIKFIGSNGYFDTTLANIAVRKGKETEVPDITLHN